MRIIAFFSRIAFICNILFLVCMIIQHTGNFIDVHAVDSVIATLGILVSPIINLAVCIVYLVKMVQRKPLGVRRWLATTNFLFLLAQIFLEFILVS
jgi:hypothetical protein